jgi:hypothetical protein
LLLALASVTQAEAASPVWKQSETRRSTMHGTWTWVEQSKYFAARWQNGSVAVVKVERLDKDQVVLTRTDTQGTTAGLTARYVGRRQGNRVQGTVEWTYQGLTAPGTWRAEEVPTEAGSLASEAISLEQAKTVFRHMASQKDITFRFPADGCYARAHVMVRRMQKLGYRPRKVWSFANGEKLYARTRNHPAGYVEWVYHVAPTLRVRLNNGKVVDAVIDPSMFNRPVTIANWAQAQKRTVNSPNPIIRRTRIGEAPVLANGTRAKGHGYCRTPIRPGDWTPTP